MASRLIDGILYSDINGVIVQNNTINVNECVYKLKNKHSVQGYICTTSCGCGNKHYLGEQICSYCGRPIRFIGKKGQPKIYK